MPFVIETQPAIRDSVSQWIIWHVIALHCVWSALLISSDAAAWVTAINSLYVLLGKSYGAVSAAVTIAAVLAGASLLRGRRDIWGILLIIPQQFLLIISAHGAITAMVLSQFADGVIRPRAFIMADQMAPVLIAIFHTCAVLEPYVRKITLRDLWTPSPPP